MAYSDSPYAEFDDNEGVAQLPADPNQANQDRQKAVQGYYKQYLGRDAGQDDQGLMGWVNGSFALPEIEGHIKSSPEAQAWSKQASAQPAPAAAGPTDWSKVTDWNANTVNDYFKSRGVTPAATSADYWAGKWNEFGKNDPAYFMKFLSNAEEFTGGPAQTAKAMGFAPGPSAGAGGGGITQGPTSDAPGSGGLQAPNPLLDLLKKQQTDAETAKAEQKAKSDALYQQLLERSKQSQVIDRNDPTMRAQTDAFRANQDRSTRNYMADLAEKNNGTLVNTGGEQRMAAEHAGVAAGGFEAELMGRELTAKRAEISDALNSMRGMLSSDQQANLQRELANLDAQIKQQSLAQQQSQFGSDLDYRYKALAQNNDQFGRNLGQQESQFGRRLGFDYESQDNDILRQLLARYAA